MKRAIYLMLLLFVFILVFILVLKISTAVNLEQELSTNDKENFDEILSPIVSIYNFIKYSSTALAGIMLLFSGITYMTSGSDLKKRENAKYTAMYTIVGLIIIWATPLIIEYLIG